MRTLSHPLRSFCLLLAFVGTLLIALMPTLAQAERPEPAEIDDVLPDFTAKDRAGKPFQLSKLDATKADIEKAVRTVAAKYGAPADAKLDTTIDKLSGLQDDGELDIAKKREMLAKMGGPFGRVTTEESVGPIKTLGDAVKWIEKLNGTPVIFICWGPRCPTSSKLNDAIHETLAALDARAIAHQPPLAEPEEPAHVGESHRVVGGLFLEAAVRRSSDRARGSRVARVLASSQVAVLCAECELALSGVEHARRARRDAGPRARRARLEVGRHRPVPVVAEGRTLDQHRGAHPHPRSVLRVQQQAEDRRHGAESRHLAEAQEAQGVRLVRVDHQAANVARLEHRPELVQLVGQVGGQPLRPARSLQRLARRPAAAAQHQDGAAIRQAFAGAQPLRLAAVELGRRDPPGEVQPPGARALQAGLQDGGQ